MGGKRRNPALAPHKAIRRRLLNREYAPTVRNSLLQAGLGLLLGPVDVRAKPVPRVPENAASSAPSVRGFDDLLRHRQYIIGKRSVEALTIAITAPARSRRDVTVAYLQVLSLIHTSD